MKSCMAFGCSFMLCVSLLQSFCFLQHSGCYIVRSNEDKDMIKPKCNKCGKELMLYGAVAWCPPETLPSGQSGGPIDPDWKIHLCVDCWWRFKMWLKER